MATKAPDLSTLHTGWIEPDGAFHPAADWTHSDAVYACGLTYPEIEKRHWLHVGIVDRVFSYGEPTQAQLDVLMDIMFHPGCCEELRGYINRYINSPVIW